MKNYPLQLLFFSLLIFLISCSKTSNNNSAPIKTHKPDSLFSWQQVEHLTGQQIIDIWFTSSLTGYFVSSDYYIYQSLDGGKSWAKVPNSASGGMQNIFFVDSQHGFAQNGQQIQITRDGGNTWILKPLPTSSAFSLFFVSPSTGYYSDIYSGVYKTSDTGNSWAQVYHSSSNNQGYYTYFLNENVGYVFSNDGNLFRTNDGSSTWQQVASNIAVKNNYPPNFNTLLFVDSFDGYYANETGLLKTTDAGVTWNIINTAGGNVNIIKFPDANIGYYLSDSAIYKTTDAGKTWTTSCRLGNDSFLGMSFINSTTGWACTGGGYIYHITP